MREIQTYAPKHTLYVALFLVLQDKTNMVARYGTWTHDPQIKSLMLYRLS